MNHFVFLDILTSKKQYIYITSIHLLSANPYWVHVFQEWIWQLPIPKMNTWIYNTMKRSRENALKKYAAKFKKDD